jgi:hypothetical protein
MNTSGARPNPSTGATVSGNYRPKKKKGSLLLNMTVWIITGLIGWAVFANIKPYEVIATHFLAGINYAALGNFFTSIPFFGGIFKAVGSLLSLGLGFMLWALFQMLELLPLALFGHANFLDNNITKVGAKKYEVNPGDRWEIKTAKMMSNSLSTEVLRFLIILGISVYVIDFFLCLYIFPPVKGGTTADLFKILYTGQFGKLDWGNMGMALCTVCAVEVLFKLRTMMIAIAEDLKA